MSTSPLETSSALTAGSTTDALDPVTFEVIRHRLWSINDEQAMIAARLSGSPIVYESYDFNAALVTGDGRGLYTGVYIMQHGATIDYFVRQVLDLWPHDEIRPGDLFFSNDPWYGALHANDGIVALPIFADDQLVMWAGIVMHDNDVGSPVPSSFVTGATERFGEAPLIPPIKLGADFTPFADIERLYLRNTRTPEHNALNMRGRVAALRVTYERITSLIDDYGLKAFLDTQQGIIDHVERVVRRRLRDIPDGEWTAQIYLDHDGATTKSYPIRCSLTKRDDQLICDFAGTAQQALGPINCARPAMEASVYGVLITSFCYDLPWAIGGLQSIVDIRSQEGTINNAIGDAAVSMASTMATLTTQDVVANACSKMLLSSPQHRSEATGSWTPGISGTFWIGTDNQGAGFLSMVHDSFGGGGGAYCFKDGIDTGGVYHSMGSRTSNVETLESRAAVLELYRRERQDSGGAGRYRGGVGLEQAVMAHKIGEPTVVNTYASGVSSPSGRGLSGGAPSGAVAYLLLRDSDARSLFSSGNLPEQLDELASSTIEIQQAKDLTTVQEHDVHWGVQPGGAGFGDPLRRDPDSVAADVTTGLVSETAAHDVYGVVVQDGSVDHDATEAARQAHRQERIDNSTPVSSAIPTGLLEGGTVLHPVSDTIEAVETATGRFIRCSLCQHDLGDYEGDYKQSTLMRELPLGRISSHNQYCDQDVFVAREFYCPGCGTIVALDIQLADEPVLPEARFFAPSDTAPV